MGGELWLKYYLWLCLVIMNKRLLPKPQGDPKEKYEALIEKGKISPDSKVLYVNDGSKDNTWEMIRDIHNNDKMFRGLCLSRNRGHQNAVLAGLMQAKEDADMVISMDADLQDDIDAIN